VNSACYPTLLGCTQDVTTYNYDLAAAGRLMAESAYPKGFETDLPPTRSTTPSQTT
jgi:peptide/nickel transport system substrate-binding protein